MPLDSAPGERVVNAAEARGSAVAVSPDGVAHLVVVTRGWALVVDPIAGTTRQLSLPDRSFPFACLATRDGHVVTGGSGWVAEIDPVTGTVTTLEVCAGEEVVGMAWAEGDDGALWFTTYPGALLVRWDRAAGMFGDPIALSATEHYATHLAVDHLGWVYAGLGTTRRSVVALPPEVGASVVPVADRNGVGCGQVRRDRDGDVLVSLESDEVHPDPESLTDWAPVLAGQLQQPRPPSGFETFGAGFARVHVPVAASWRVAELDLPEHRLVVEGLGAARQVGLPYDSDGAELSPFIAIDDARGLLGTSNHPLQLWSHDLRSGRSVVHGRAVIAPADGNIAAWARWGRFRVGASYTSGRVHLCDPGRPWEEGRNPVLLGTFRDIYRPRCAVVVDDLFVAGGYGAYGETGGGLAFVELPSGRATTLTHHQVVPHQATTALAALSDGLVLGATSLEAPGGAGRTAPGAAQAYLLDLATRVVGARWEPVEGVATWSAAATTADGLVHLVSHDGVHVLVDPGRPGSGEVVSRIDLGPMAHGGAVRDGAVMYLVHERGVVAADLVTHEVVVGHRSAVPLTAGGAVVDGTLFAGSGPRLVALRLDLA